MKKWMAMGALGLLMILPACATSDKSPAMRAEMKRQAQYYDARADALDREASKLERLAKETKEKAADKRREAKKFRARAKKLKKGESPLPLLPE